MTVGKQKPEILVTKQRLGGYAWEVRLNGVVLGQSHQAFSTVEGAIKSLKGFAEVLRVPALSYRVVDPYAEREEK